MLRLKATRIWRMKSPGYKIPILKRKKWGKRILLFMFHIAMEFGGLHEGLSNGKTENRPRLIWFWKSNCGKICLIFSERLESIFCWDKTFSRRVSQQIHFRMKAVFLVTTHLRCHTSKLYFLNVFRSTTAYRTQSRKIREKKSKGLLRILVCWISLKAFCKERII